MGKVVLLGSPLSCPSWISPWYSSSTFDIAKLSFSVKGCVLWYWLNVGVGRVGGINGRADKYVEKDVGGTGGALREEIGGETRRGEEKGVFAKGLCMVVGAYASSCSYIIPRWSISGTAG